MQSFHETSGELLARSLFLGSPLQVELAGLLERFDGFVGEGLKASNIELAYLTNDAHIQTALEATRVLRNEVNARYARRIERFQKRAENLLRSSELSRALKDSKCDDNLEALDRELLGLCTSYSGVIHEEYDEYSRIERNRIAHIDRQIANAQTRFKLCRFGEFIQTETEGAIHVRNLDPGDSQFARCKRAVLENSRITSASNLTGEVVDVFKIENKPLLKHFEKECASVKNGRVKGLFAPISQDLIERTAVCGLSSPVEVPDTLKSAFVLCPASKSAKGRRAIESSDEALSLSIRFSRYSFSMEDADARREVQVLALCRVLVSRLYTVKPDFQDYKAISQTLANEYDAIFRPDTEEYTILRHQFVLPEFIIRYQVFRTDGDVSNTIRRSRSYLRQSSSFNSLASVSKATSCSDKCVLYPDYRLTAFAAHEAHQQNQTAAVKNIEEPGVTRLDSYVSTITVMCLVNLSSKATFRRAGESERTTVEKVATLAKSAILHEIKKRII